MNPSLKSLAIVCPMANEAASAERFVLDVLGQCRGAEIPDLALFVVLDRASTDDTLQILRRLASAHPELRVVYAPENRGVVDAYVRGYREALNHGSDWILEMDAGYSHQPSEIPRYLERLGPNVDCLFGTRFSSGGTFEGGISRRFVVSRLGGLLSRLLLGGRLSDMTSGFQLFARVALQQILAVPLVSRGPFFQTEIKHRARRLRVVEVPITYRPTASVVRSGSVIDALRVLLLLFVKRMRSGE